MLITLRDTYVTFRVTKELIRSRAELIEFSLYRQLKLLDEQSVDTKQALACDDCAIIILYSPDTCIECIIDEHPWQRTVSSLLSKKVLRVFLRYKKDKGMTRV